MQTRTCHPERVRSGGRIARSALKIAPRHHHSAVILRSAATKDPQLFFHPFGWNTVPSSTAVSGRRASVTLGRHPLLAISIALLFFATPLYAHVGSPDVYAEGQAGPYKLSVVVRPPLVIPGVAEIEVRTQTPGIERITVTPVPLTGEASKHPPVPDAMDQPSKDSQFYTAHLWIMASGSWQIRFAVSGSRGAGVLSIPFPATAMTMHKMQTGLGIFLAALGLLLVVGMVGIVGAGAREAKLPPGRALDEKVRRRAYVAMSVTFAVLVAAIVLGNTWWKSEAADYAGNVYKPLQMDASVGQGNVLDLKLRDPGWLQQRKLDDWIPDHNHLMHLYMIRWPQMDVVFHLHPDPVATGEFQLALPSVPAGDYRLYADVVHAIGFPETIVGNIALPQISGRPLQGDDAEGKASPLNVSPAGETAGLVGSEQRFRLPDGYTMVWKKPAQLVPKTAVNFQFDLLGPDGTSPSDMKLYMGMLGHAAFVKTDGTVFAHIHPTGTVAMAAFMMANPQSGGQGTGGSGMSMQDMPGMDSSPGALPNTVGFPYGFPSPGQYRIFVQMKHGNTVETGVFDADVASVAK